MRATIELPDELFERAKRMAAESGLSLQEFFIEALVGQLEGKPKKFRRDPPTIDGPVNMPMLSREELDEAMFG